MTIDRETIGSISKQSERVTAELHDLKKQNTNRDLDDLHEATCAPAMLIERLVLVIEADASNPRSPAPAPHPPRPAIR